MKKQVYQKPTIVMMRFDSKPLMNVVSVKTNLEDIEDIEDDDTGDNPEEAWSRGDLWGGAWEE